VILHAAEELPVLSIVVRPIEQGRPVSLIFIRNIQKQKQADMIRLEILLGICFISMSVILADQSPSADQSDLDDPLDSYIDKGYTDGIANTYDSIANPARRSISSSRRRISSRRRSSSRRRRNRRSSGLREQPFCITVIVSLLFSMIWLQMK